MLSHAEILRCYLVANSQILAPGQIQRPRDSRVQGFLASMPDDIDNALGFYDVGGKSFGRIQRDGQSARHSGIQLLMRHRNYNEGFDFFDTLARWIDSNTATTGKSVTINDKVYYFHTVYRTSDLISLGEEKDTRRWFWSLHYNVVPDKAPTNVE